MSKSVRTTIHKAKLLALAIAVLCALPMTPALAEDRNCTATEKADGNAWLWLNARDRALAIKTHLPWGVPGELAPTTNERLLVQRDYVNRYDADLRVPMWSAERIRFSALGKVDGRVSCFRPDPRLPTDAAATPEDYKEPIYDQGHMSPDADQDSSVRSAINTYIMSNMTPQNCQLNRGIWQILEGLTRRWAKKEKVVYVLSGSVFDRDGNGVRDADTDAERMKSNNGKRRVAVPSAFYKIVAYNKPDGSVATLSLLLPHTTANPNGHTALDYLTDHITTITAIERLTGYDLFPEATDLEESTTLWPFEGPTPRSLCQQDPS